MGLSLLYGRNYSLIFPLVSENRCIYMEHTSHDGRGEQFLANMDNVISKTCNHDPRGATDTKNSYLTWQFIRPAGHFSHLFITTKNASGCTKSTGGDYWKVSLKGPSIVSASVFDLRNGSYEAVFLPVKAGRYKVVIILIYSLCKISAVMEPRESYSNLGTSLSCLCVKRRF